MFVIQDDESTDFTNFVVLLVLFQGIWKIVKSKKIFCFIIFQMNALIMKIMLLMDTYLKKMGISWSNCCGLPMWTGSSCARPFKNMSSCARIEKSNCTHLLIIFYLITYFRTLRIKNLKHSFEKCWHLNMFVNIKHNYFSYLLRIITRPFLNLTLFKTLSSFFFRFFRCGYSIIIF